MRKLKVISILLVCVFLLGACGSNNKQSSIADKNTALPTTQPTTQPSDNNPPKGWEPNPISDFDYEYNDSLNGIEVCYKGESERVWYPSEINGDPVVAIGSTVRNRKNITEVFIPEGIKKIGDYAFENCVNLKSIIIPEGVTTIGYSAFYKCVNLSNIVVPDSVNKIENKAFYACDSLTNFKFPSNLKLIGDQAFCSVPLTDIILPDGLETIRSMAFTGCDEVKSVVIPGSVKTIGDGAFSLCDKLAEITLADPEALIDIRYDAFDGTYWYNKQPEGFIFLGANLVGYKGEITETKLVIPDGTKTIASLIGSPSIQNVIEIVLPDGLKHISIGAFAQAYSLKAVNIPDSVEYIGDNAFKKGSLDEATIERITKINPLGAQD